ncbi:MAG TPA: DnaD domain protein [Bacilli bacterium]|nr:MAG: Replication initiation and membrane attachment protein [Tenericutes bacterium ADurb.BinA124]HPX83762.1 DnaD domain protein [Bacilli bacterium]HQC73935.1 DnaD domain protein [Bacilli bacterium]
MAISISDNFKITQKHALSGEDYFVLSQMYLPIIGIDSFSLYHLLFTLNESDTYSIKKLVDFLSCSSPSFLEQALHKLEGVSLIDTYYHEHKGYLFNLKTPLSRTSFLENSLLASFLSMQIGEVEMKKMQEQDKINVRQYKEISKAFDEVYDVSTDNVSNLFKRLFKVKKNKGIKVINPDFDYIVFKMSFDTDFFDQKLLDDEDFKQHILSISYNYKLNEEEMKEVIEKTISADRDLKYTDISKHAKAMFQLKHKQQRPRILTKTPDAFLQSQMDDDYYRVFEVLENKTPSDILAELSGIQPSVAEVEMFQQLIDNTKFPISVINLMILYVNTLKKGELPNYNYFEKLANVWARMGIKNVKDALDYLNQPKPTKEVKKGMYAKKEKPLPDWYDQYTTQLSKKKENETLSEEEVNKILSEAEKKYN